MQHRLEKLKQKDVLSRIAIAKRLVTEYNIEIVGGLGELGEKVWCINNTK